MEENHHKEIMQLLSCTNTTNPHSHTAPSPSSLSQPPTSFDGPSLDLQLSISVGPLKPPPPHQERVLVRKVRRNNNNKMDYSSGGGSGVEYLKWQAAEQIRLAAMEKAYAERVREMTRREMEIAQSEFARAHNMWERAREEVERAERMKERATTSTLKIDSSCMEITCLSCSQNFRP
ncbi:hypothetical protein MIMGU_mgv1a020776mg [Erythranthe guttata]|uniref:Uncharacterized protein n=2 Tax=Erythranthe guttata TaxID=4155 RepID=A0A022Q668_ERYGU|nr:hypothetical protein MIMGU_mgv1a020776mg [Erythranthe guttata]